MPWPVYEEVVKEFFEAAEQDCWMDFDYVPDQAGQLLLSEDGVRQRHARSDQDDADVLRAGRAVR